MNALSDRDTRPQLISMSLTHRVRPSTVGVRK